MRAQISVPETEVCEKEKSRTLEASGEDGALALSDVHVKALAFLEYAQWDTEVAMQVQTYGTAPAPKLYSFSFVCLPSVLCLREACSGVYKWKLTKLTKLTACLCLCACLPTGSCRGDSRTEERERQSRDRRSPSRPRLRFFVGLPPM